LQGRHLSRPFHAETIQQAQTLLQQALVLDPGYAAAWIELSLVYRLQMNNGLRPYDEEGHRLAREAVNKALAIDPDYALAHARLGSIALEYDNDLAAAARHLERALQLEPANSDVIRGASWLAQALGRLDEAIALLEFQVARDPVNSSIHFLLGLFYNYAGRWDESIASHRNSLMLSPGRVNSLSAIGVALLLKGEPQAALEAMQVIEEEFRDHGTGSTFPIIGLALVYHALGRADESDAALAELIEQYEQSASYNIAYVLAYRGEADRAFEWLDKAVAYKDSALPDIIDEPLFANIHDDPRWLPFLESIGKSPEQLAAIEFKVTLPK
jgi:tetratricopeptide (TPR) repeat protein